VFCANSKCEAGAAKGHLLWGWAALSLAKGCAATASSARCTMLSSNGTGAPDTRGHGPEQRMPCALADRGSWCTSSSPHYWARGRSGRSVDSTSMQGGVHAACKAALCRTLLRTRAQETMTQMIRPQVLAVLSVRSTASSSRGLKSSRNPVAVHSMQVPLISCAYAPLRAPPCPTMCPESTAQHTKRAPGGAGRDRRP